MILRVIQLFLKVSGRQATDFCLYCVLTKTVLNYLYNNELNNGFLFKIIGGPF
jgi:hypothetical protein